MARRKRYKVRCSEGYVTVLAYTGQGAVNAVVSAKNWHVIEVVRDTQRGTKPRWEVDKAALHHACRLLKIKWPVKITRTSSLDHHGCHHLNWKPFDRTPSHYIVANKLASAAQADVVIWHELTHAKQAEEAARKLGFSASVREMAKAWAEVNKANHKRRYKHRPIEHEAQAYEQCAPFMPLTKETKYA